MDKDTSTKIIAYMMHTYLMNVGNPRCYATKLNSMPKMNGLREINAIGNPPSRSNILIPKYSSEIMETEAYFEQTSTSDKRQNTATISKTNIQNPKPTSTVHENQIDH